MKSPKNFWLLVSFVLIVALVAFRPYIGGQNGDYTTEIAAAGLGTILAACVTFILLQSQSHSEEAKEKGVAIYQQKLDAYNHLMDALEEAMCEGKPKELAVNKLRFQAFRTRLVAHEIVHKQLVDFSESYKDLVADDEFSDEDWDMSKDAVTALVDAMRIDLKADREGKSVEEILKNRKLGSTKAEALETSPTSSSVHIIESEEAFRQDVSESSQSVDFTPKISKETFLMQCAAEEKPYFEELLRYCESHSDQVLVDWGGKGFSIKDNSKRQLVWMFPKVGANSKSNINARTQKWTAEEKTQIESILRANGIAKGWSWRPADLPLEQTKNIINLFCRIS